MKQPIEINGLCENLPQDVNDEITSHLLALDTKELSALACLSSHHYQFFYPFRCISQLLFCVATGDQNAAEKLIKKHPELLLQRGTVTDYSGRTFTNITAFEYALWALDTRYMCNMMLDCLSVLGDEKRGEMIKRGLLCQYKAFENNNGVRYTTRDGIEHQEKHFDFSPLLNALKDCVDNFTNWDFWTRVAHWCRVVGLAQCELPAHVRQHYCDKEESFDPTPAFNKETFKRSLKIYNCETSKDEIWGPCGLMNLSDLGFKFGISRDWRIPRSTWLLPYKEASVDGAALAALFMMRTKDFADLNDRLQNPLQKPKSKKCVIF